MPTRRAALSVWTLALLGSLLSFVGCGKVEDPWTGEAGPPRVLVTVPALYCFTKNVGGDHVGVKCLCKDTGPHDFKPETNDQLLLRSADRFFIIGLGLDDQFSEKMMAGSGKNADARVALGSKLPDDLKRKGEEENSTDPHVWLGTPQAIKMVEMIRDELKKADAGHAADYDKNAAKYIDELNSLKAFGDKQLEGKKDKRIISFHDSLQYFAHDFGFEIADVIEEGPGDEPTSEKMKSLVDKCVKENIRVIAVEPQYPTTTSATTLLNELKKKGKTDVVLVEIDPLETAKNLSADLYVKTMRKNLEDLAKNLP